MNAPIDQLVSNLETKATLDDEDVFCLIGTFNHALLGNVDGPNCTDRSICNNNCCSIMIDIPHVLAKKYIDEGWLAPGDVRRGDVFAWTLNVRQNTSKCVFFSPELYGCKAYVDHLDTRPPQCAVYPAGYAAGAERCKAGAGPWLVRDAATGAACERLMGVYKRYCIVERDRIKRQIVAAIPGALEGHFSRLLADTSPSSIAGIKETWSGFEPLLAEGRSFSAKQFCDAGCEIPFLECKHPCHAAASKLVTFLEGTLPAFIESRDMKEEYTLLELKEFTREQNERDRKPVTS